MKPTIRHTIAVIALGVLSGSVLAQVPIAAPVMTDVQIMFCGDCKGLFSEYSTIQNADFWYFSTDTTKTTVKDMVLGGWSIQSVFNLNASQFYIVFVKYAPPAAIAPPPDPAPTDPPPDPAPARVPAVKR